MKCAGQIRSFDGRGDLYEISRAVILRTKLSVDWIESGEVGHLDATSSDGIDYVGSYGYSRPDQNRSLRLKRFEAADGTMLLLGSWHETNGGYEGTWYFVLNPIQ